MESPPSPGPAAGRRTTRTGRGPASVAAIAAAGRRRRVLLPVEGRLGPAEAATIAAAGAAAGPCCRPADDSDRPRPGLGCGDRRRRPPTAGPAAGRGTTRAG